MLPQTRGQLERLIDTRPLSAAMRRKAETFAIPLVFMVDAGQQHAIEEALSRAVTASEKRTRAAGRAAALTYMAQSFIERCEEPPDRV